MADFDLFLGIITLRSKEDMYGISVSIIHENTRPTQTKNHCLSHTISMYASRRALQGAEIRLKAEMSMVPI